MQALPQPVPSHIFGTMAAAALYLGYSAIGKAITGHTSFWWMDPALAGSPAKVAGYCSGFVFLAVASEFNQHFVHFSPSKHS